MSVFSRRGLLPLGALAAAPWLVAARRSLSGVWSGFVAQDDPPTRIRLRIAADGKSGQLGVIGLGELPLSRLEAAAGRLSFEIAKPSIRYQGRLTAAGEIVGVCARGGQDIPLTFVRGDLYTETPAVILPPGPLSPAKLRFLLRMAKAPAMGVGWQRKGGEVRVLVDGYRAADGPVKVRPGDRWHLGSITKSMTATLAARLVEAGKLTWGSTLDQILGDRVADMQPAYRDLTLLHVLSHHGGLDRDVPPAAYRDAGADQRLFYVRAALKQPPVGPKEKAMAYSNNDYVVAGLMLETAAGQPWEHLIASQVFAPLGITSFGFGPPGTGRLDQPQGHVAAERGWAPVHKDLPEALGPAGRVHMSLADLVAFLQAHRDKPEPFLSQASWRTLHTPPFGGDYALGWEVSDTGVLFHGGTNSWWKAEVRVDPVSGVVCAAAANALNDNTQSALLQLEDAADLSH